MLWCNGDAPIEQWKCALQQLRHSKRRRNNVSPMEWRKIEAVMQKGGSDARVMYWRKIYALRQEWCINARDTYLSKSDARVKHWRSSKVVMQEWCSSEVVMHSVAITQELCSDAIFTNWSKSDTQMPHLWTVARVTHAWEKKCPTFWNIDCK